MGSSCVKLHDPVPRDLGPIAVTAERCGKQEALEFMETIRRNPETIHTLSGAVEEIERTVAGASRRMSGCEWLIFEYPSLQIRLWEAGSTRVHGNHP